MNMMIAITIRPGATTAAARVTVPKAGPDHPPPAATRTRKKVPTASEMSRRHSCFGSWKSMTRVVTSCSISLTDALFDLLLLLISSLPGAVNDPVAPAGLVHEIRYWSAGDGHLAARGDGGAVHGRDGCSSAGAGIAAAEPSSV